MQVQGGERRHVGQAKLPTYGMDFIMHVGVACVAAGVVGDLPAAVAGDTGFEQEFLLLDQRQELADAPVQGEV